MPAPYLGADDKSPVVAAIDARHAHVYLQVFAPGGRTLIAPRLAPLERRGAGGVRQRRRASSARPRKPSPPGLPKTAPAPVTVDARAAPDIAWVAQIGAVVPEASCAAEAAISARARRAAAKCRAIAAPMMNFVSRLLSRGEPTFSEARPARRRRDRRRAWRFVPARLGRG